ncbi:MAG: DUF99 family protein [Thermoplasmata archaeon]
MDINSLFNKDTRIIAFDDAPFSRGDRHAVLLGLIMRKDMYIESIFKRKIEVDGSDATEAVVSMVREKGSGVSLIMTQGITFGGFNILDVDEVFHSTGIPIINVVDHEPDLAALKSALRKHFIDWERRFSLLQGHFSRADRLYIQSIGLDFKQAYKFVKQVTLSGQMPEPLRLADMIASVIP